MWDILLTSLKFLGLMVSGFAGYIAALPEPKNKKARKPPPHHWLRRTIGNLLSKEWTLRWVVIGLGVALLSQFVETIKSAHDTKEASEKDRQQIGRAEEQIRLAHQSLTSLDEELTMSKESLQHLERLATRLESVEVKVTLTLQPDFLSWSNLLHDSDHSTSELTEHFVPSSNVVTWISTPAGGQELSVPNTIEGYSNMLTKLSESGSWSNNTSETIASLAAISYYSQTNRPSIPREKPKVSPGVPPGLVFGTIPSKCALASVINTPGLSLNVYSQPVTDFMILPPKLFTRDLARLSPTTVRYLPPKSYTNSHLPLKFESFSTSTNWAVSITYHFAFDVTQSSLASFPLSLPDLATKEGLVTFTNNLIQTFRSVTCNDLVFNFGHSIVALDAFLTMERQSDDSSDPNLTTWSITRSGSGAAFPDFGRPGRFQMPFRFPDKDLLFGRNRQTVHAKTKPTKTSR